MARRLPLPWLVPGASANLGRLALLFATALAISGCVTSKKYRLAKDDTPPAVPLDWMTEASGAELHVREMIVFKGPGSWKREARWDEYVVQLKNSGTESLVIQSAELIDVLGEPQMPGSDPWALEKLSYTNWDLYGKKGLYLLAGAGAVLVFAGAATAIGLGAVLSGGAAAGGAVAVLNIIPVVAILDIAVVAAMNRSNKSKVFAEFSRRRLELPVTIAPAEERTGSWFFPMTPAPRELVVRAQTGGEHVVLRLPLPELAKLHLKP
jgi:hypothetical protein